MVLPPKQIKNIPVWFPEEMRDEYDLINRIPYRKFPTFVREVTQVAIRDLKRQLHDMKKPHCKNCGEQHAPGDPCPGPSYDAKESPEELPDPPRSLTPEVGLDKFGLDPVKLGLRRL